MRKRVTTILVSLSVLAGFVFAGSSGMPVVQVPSKPAAPQNQSHNPQSDNDKMIDLKSDDGFQREIGGVKLQILVGNVAAHHNGAVITCDSAVRHSDSRLECFGNVLINKGTTYIYGDRAEYDRTRNEARVYSQIVKVSDREATLYTYNFLFNTQTNVGEYYGGGVVVDEDNMLESDRGYYYSDIKDIVCVDNVEMRNDTYKMKGDSVIYNVETNKAKFFTNTNIWNEKEQEYLYADCGAFDRDSQQYTLTLNGYILTEKQELWSDSLDYYRDRGYVLLKNNIQIDDIEHKMLAFGDWGEYWKEPGNVLLTREPSVVSYDLEQGDSVFLRADSMFLYTRNTEAERREKESKALSESDTKGKETKAENGEKETKVMQKKTPETPKVQQKESRNSQSIENASKISEAENSENHAEKSDSLVVDSPKTDSLATDSLKVDSVAVDTLTKAQRKAMLREQQKKEREELRKVKAEELRKKLDEIADHRQAKRTALLRKMEAADSVRRERAAERAEAKLQRSLAKLARKKIKLASADSATVAKADSTLMAEYALTDSLANNVLDSLLAIYFPKEQTDSLAADTLAKDSIYRMILGYRNVRMYRSDFQSVCDSIVATSIDSIIHLYIEPVLWNDNNQVTSEIMHIITRNQQIVRADFEGKPLTIAEIDTAHYNQVAGKEMSAHFKDNQIYRNDVNGNVRTIYYIEENDPPEITMMAYVESADMSSYIENKQVTGITYRGNPTYKFYPLDKIPESQPLRLDGFKWEKARRPARDSVFTRKIRPSLREVKSALEKPRFPINEQLERNKERYIRNHSWSDRTDTLSVETIEWLESISSIF